MAASASTAASKAPPRYRITGSAARSRLVPLLPADWIEDHQNPDFLWENAPRHDTRSYRDNVQVYSHLPNALAILDSKWALARLLPQEELETHCFRGRDGFEEFRRKVQLMGDPTAEDHSNNNSNIAFPDLMMNPHDFNAESPPAPHNWWVVKDASSNGAGGIWVVGPANVDRYSNHETTPLLPDHAYVAQKYAWPLVLYKGRKCHVRVYGLVTSDGRAFLHRASFLHVANHAFTWQNVADSVHITNCCANSDDPTKFAGEICADLLLSPSSNNTVVGLADYFPAMKARMASLAQAAFPLIQGGQQNRGFEYLGMDFVLSRDRHGQPTAHLLEVNAPPSQDTATGLAHAESLHDRVIADLISLWVVPHISGTPPHQGGWQCVYQHDVEPTHAAPSKAAILNKMRWAIRERQILKQQEDEWRGYSNEGSTGVQRMIRCNYFAYFDEERRGRIFMENAGGAQVPRHVTQAMCGSLECRDRSVRGVQSVANARQTLKTLLRADHVFFGPNATSLLARLAQAIEFTPKDEIVLSIENHVANVQPWIEAAEKMGAMVKWWKPWEEPLSNVITSSTRIVAVSHASNILGELRDLTDMQETVNRVTKGRGWTVVDGVAAGPHAQIQASAVDWYVVSCHKLFGPHIGAICGSQRVTQDVPEKVLEVGTLNYEACEGIAGLGNYFSALARHHDSTETEDLSSETIASRQDVKYHNRNSHPLQMLPLTGERARRAYELIESVEAPLTKALVSGLQAFAKVRIVSSPLSTKRLPVVSFVHSEISSSEVVAKCRAAGVVCRSGTFLGAEQLFRELGVDSKIGVVRLSLLHYNTVAEVKYAMKVLGSIPGWQ